MRTLIDMKRLLLLSIIISSLNCTNKSSHLKITHGTCIIACVSSDSVVFAADSKAISNEMGIGSSSDTTSKIKHIGSFYFMGAGIGKMGNQSIDNIIRSNYGNNFSFDDNVNNIGYAIKNNLFAYLNQLSNSDKIIMRDKYINHIEPGIIVAQFVNGKPFLGAILIRVSENDLHFIVSEPKFTIEHYTRDFVIPVGEVDDILPLVEKGPEYKNAVKYAIKLITIEANKHPELVDSKIKYAIIKRGGVVYKKNYR